MTRHTAYSAADLIFTSDPGTFRGEDRTGVTGKAGEKYNSMLRVAVFSSIPRILIRDYCKKRTEQQAVQEKKEIAEKNKWHGRSVILDTLDFNPVVLQDSASPEEKSGYRQRRTSALRISPRTLPPRRRSSVTSRSLSFTITSPSTTDPSVTRMVK